MTLVSLKNIGREMQKKLESVGVCQPQDLRQLGSKAVFLHLKRRYPKVCLVHLYTLQAAIDGIELSQLPETIKKDLKQFSDSLKPAD